MLEFVCHPKFEKSVAGFQRRFSAFDRGLDAFKRICERQFHPTKPETVIPPGKIHRIKVLDNYTIWKVELVVKGLKPNHFPRLWFAVKGSTLVFLCIGTHIDNYDNNEMDRASEILATDLF